MSRHDRLYLNDMIEVCEKLAACIEGRDRATLEVDWIRCEDDACKLVAFYRREQVKYAHRFWWPRELTERQ